MLYQTLIVIFLVSGSCRHLKKKLQLEIVNAVKYQVNKVNAMSYDSKIFTYVNLFDIAQLTGVIWMVIS